MNAARYHGPHDVRVEAVDPDPVGPDEVRIDVAACGICGSDLHTYEGGGSVPEAPHPVTGQSRPLTLGHEVAGTVAQTGENAPVEVDTPVAVNPLVWCGECRSCRAGAYNRCSSGGFVGISSNGGFAETLVVSAEKAVPLPGSIDVETAALVEPFAVGLHAVRRSSIEVGDAVAVFGAGPIGLTIVQAARAAGAGELVVSEPNSSRRALAEGSGADAVVDPAATDAVSAVREATDGGADVTFEAAGVASSVDAAVRATRSGGWVTAVGLFDAPVSVPLAEVVRREVTVTGSAAYQGGPLARRAFRPVIRGVQTGSLTPDGLVTGRIDLDAIVEDGFEALLDPETEHAKVLVTP